MVISDYTPLVSIVITSFNRERWISKAIESALQQDYPNLEIIISDNHSSDNSDELIKQFLPDKRIKYSRNEHNIGMFKNFEKAFFELSSGEYVINVSSDDYLLNKSFISKSVDIIKRYDNVLLVFGKYLSHYESLKKNTFSPIPEYYTKEFRPGKEAFLDFAKNPYFGWAGCLLSRKKLIELSVHFSGNICFDIETNLKMMMYGNVGYVNENVYAVRMHSNNETGKILSADEYISTRLNLFENAIELYKKNYGIDEAITKWRDIVLKRDIANITIFLLAKDKTEAKIFLEYVKTNYPVYYQNLGINWVSSLRRYALVTIIKHKYLRKMASFIRIYLKQIKFIH